MKTYRAPRIYVYVYLTKYINWRNVGKRGIIPGTSTVTGRLIVVDDQIEAADRTSTRGILNDLWPIRVPYRGSSFAPSRAAGSLRGYRCPSSRPAGFAGRRGGGILLLLLYFLLLHLLVFRWTRNRPQGWRSECEREHTSKGGGEKLVKDPWLRAARASGERRGSYLRGEDPPVFIDSILSTNAARAKWYSMHLSKIVFRLVNVKNTFFFLFFSRVKS